MPDAKRKLPVLLLLREDIAAHCDAGPIYAYTSVYGAPAQGRGDSETHALYEPAVPRCRTCKNWIDGLGGYRCEQPTQLWTPGASENGYCHNHSDLK